MSNYKPSYGDAVVSLSNGKTLGGPTDGPITEWQFTKGATPPAEEDIQAKLAELTTEFDAQAYARDRITAYPSTGDQLDYIYHNGVAKWKTDMIDPVKTKYPKG